MTHRSLACGSGRGLFLFCFPLRLSWLEFNKFASSSLWPWMTWERYFPPSNEEDKRCLSELSAEEVRLALQPRAVGYVSHSLLQQAVQEHVNEEPCLFPELSSDTTVANYKQCEVLQWLSVLRYHALRKAQQLVQSRALNAGHFCADTAHLHNKHVHSKATYLKTNLYAPSVQNQTEGSSISDNAVSSGGGNNQEIEFRILSSCYMW